MAGKKVVQQFTPDPAYAISISPTSFGAVRPILWDGSPAIAKIFKGDTKDAEYSSLVPDLHFLQSLQHTNIVKPLDIVFTTERIDANEEKEEKHEGVLLGLLYKEINALPEGNAKRKELLEEARRVEESGVLGSAGKGKKEKQERVAVILPRACVSLGTWFFRTKAQQAAVEKASSAGLPQPLDVVRQECKTNITRIQLLPGIFYQAMRGLAYMHSQGVMHRDIKLENMLVFTSDETPDNILVRHTDFGLSAYYYPKNFYSDNVYTSPYRPPEVINGDKYDYSADVWALGASFFEIYIQEQYLFQGTIADIEKYMINSPPNPTKFKQPPLRAILAWHGGEFVADLLEKMMQFDPKKRITALAALNHPYFAPAKPKVDKDYPAEPIIPRICDNMLVDKITVNWKASQPDIPSASRFQLLQWLYEVNAQLKNSIYPIALTVALLDTLLAGQIQATPNTLLLIAVACNYLSLCLSDTTVTMGIMEKISGDTVKKAEIAKVVEIILSKRDFNLSVPTIAQFTAVYLPEQTKEQAEMLKVLIMLVYLAEKAIFNYSLKDLATFCVQVLQILFKDLESCRRPLSAETTDGIARAVLDVFPSAPGGKSFVTDLPEAAILKNIIRTLTTIEV